MIHVMVHWFATLPPRPHHPLPVPQSSIQYKMAPVNTVHAALRLLRCFAPHYNIFPLETDVSGCFWTKFYTVRSLTTWVDRIPTKFPFSFIRDLKKLEGDSWEWQRYRAFSRSGQRSLHWREVLRRRRQIEGFLYSPLFCFDSIDAKCQPTRNQWDSLTMKVTPTSVTTKTASKYRTITSCSHQRIIPRVARVVSPCVFSQIPHRYVVFPPNLTRHFLYW